MSSLLSNISVTIVNGPVHYEQKPDKDLSGNTVAIAWGWQEPEEFVRDLRSYKANAGDVNDLSGARKRWSELEKQLLEDRNKVFEQSINPIGSNANWGRITQPDELQGAFLEEVGIEGVKTPQRCAEFYQDINDYLFRHRFGDKEFERIIEGCEITAPILSPNEEVGTVGETEWFCKGCNKYFATKSSLKRHHDRKKSCKDICETVSTEPNPISVPEKPYIIDWIDQLQTKAISGDTDKPYCRHCDVEFANKSNLNKHLSKSIACDKLAKQEFVKLIQTV